MNKRTLHMIGGYGILLIAFALLVGPTLILAQMRHPQFVALTVTDDAPVALSAPSVQ